MPLHSSQVVLDFILYPVLNQADWKPDLDKQVIVSTGHIDHIFSGKNHAVFGCESASAGLSALDQPA